MRERIEGVDKRARELEEETEKRSAKLGGLNLRHLVRIHGPIRFFDLSSFVYWVTRQLRCSFAFALPPPLTQVLPPTQILPPPPPASQAPLKEDPDATGKPDAIYTSQQVNGGVTSYQWASACVPLC